MIIMDGEKAEREEEVWYFSFFLLSATNVSKLESGAHSIKSSCNWLQWHFRTKSKTHTHTHTHTNTSVWACLCGAFALLSPCLTLKKMSRPEDPTHVETIQQAPFDDFMFKVIKEGMIHI